MLVFSEKGPISLLLLVATVSESDPGNNDAVSVSSNASNSVLTPASQDVKPSDLILIAWNLQGSSDPVISNSQRQVLKDARYSAAFLSEVSINNQESQVAMENAWKASLFTNHVYFNPSNNKTARGGVGLVISSQCQAVVEKVE